MSSSYRLAFGLLVERDVLNRTLSCNERVLVQKKYQFILSRTGKLFVPADGSYVPDKKTKLERASSWTYI